MLYQFPPVGSRVCLDKGTCEEQALPSFLSSQRARYYASGTAALAAAIQAVVGTTDRVKQGDVAEVILPAYGCPDLVSAAVYAGVKPILVDLEANRPWMDLDQLQSAITGNTVAIIGVNLFGISERWQQLREISDEKGLALIEDSAQYFPGKTVSQNWQGDLTILSFGRGKPVSLLGGGAVICNKMDMFASLPGFPLTSVSTLDQLKFSLKARLYNAIICPRLYWLPQSLPFLHLGETRYHALHEIIMMDQQRFCLLATNIRYYEDDNLADRRNELMGLMLEQHKAIINLPKECGVPSERRLLRYPVLLDVESRDAVYHDLKKAGLGASVMYPASLPNITGLSGLLNASKSFPNAEAFAHGLMTLPIHSQVSEREIDRMGAIFKSI